MNSSAHQTIEMGSERSFGFVFAVVFLIVGLWPLYYGGEVRFWAIGITLGFLFVACFKPDLLKPFNRMWFKFGLVLGKIVAPLVMVIVFILVVVPTGLIAKILGKDPLGIKAKGQKSYWIDRSEEDGSGSMNHQF